MCKCTYTVVVALQSFIALTAMCSILAPPTPFTSVLLPSCARDWEGCAPRAYSTKILKMLHYNTANRAQYAPWSCN